MELSLNPRRITLTLLGIIALLVTMHVAQLVVYYQINNPDVFDFVEFLDLDYEANLPSFYSSTAILFCAALLWIIGLIKGRERAPFRHHWIGLAVIFTLLAMDEAIAVHENIGDLMEDMDWVNAEGYLYFAWVVPYSFLLLLFAVAYLKFLYALPRQTMILFIYAGLIYVGGALGLDAISAHEADLHGSETIYYSFLYTVEELCEMTGIVIFGYALMRYIEAQYGRILLNFRTAPKS